MSLIFSPFTDTHDVVEPRYFVGRQDLFEKFSANLKDNPDNPKFFLITGNSKLGKSSLLNYFRHHIENDFRFLCCGIHYVSSKEINDLDSIVEPLIADLFYNLDRDSFDSDEDYDDIMGNLSENIVERGWKNNIKFKKSFVNNVKEHFAEFLFDVSNKINHKGIFIEVDTLDRSEKIASVSKFSKWISEAAHDLKNMNLNTPIAFAAALPKYAANEFFDSSRFSKNEVIACEVKRLSDENVRKFLNEGFNRVDWKISAEIMDLLVDLSCGHPKIMNDCGSDIYWGCGDSSWVDEAEEDGMRVYGYMPKNTIDSKEIALDALCRDCNDEYYLNMIKLSDTGKTDGTCCSILNKLSDLFKDNYDDDLHFKKKALLELLNEEETLIFDDYLERLLELEVIRFDEKNGTYIFMDSPFLLTFKIWSMAYDEDKVKKRIEEHKRIYDRIFNRLQD